MILDFELVLGPLARHEQSPLVRTLVNAGGQVITDFQPTI